MGLCRDMDFVGQDMHNRNLCKLVQEWHSTSDVLLRELCLQQVAVVSFRFQATHAWLVLVLLISFSA